MYYLFIDFEKAFDLVSTEKVIAMLTQLNRVEIKVRRGVKQGDVVSPTLFIGVLQMIMNEIDWGDYGVNVNGRKLAKLLFADDVILIGRRIDDIENMVDRLAKKCEEYGLKINVEKCRLMTKSTELEERVVIGGKEVKKEKNFVYLGQLLSLEGQSAEISRRCALGWGAMIKDRAVYKSGIAMPLKRKLWEMTVLPTITYACETWIMTPKVRNKLRVTVRAMERYILGKTRRDRIRNTTVRKLTGFNDIVKSVMKRKWKWAGHIGRTKDDRYTKAIMEWYPREYKRGKGRPKFRWDQEMRLVGGGATWRRVAEERQEWKRIGSVYREVWLE